MNPSAVDAAIVSRMSARAFTSQAVAKADLEEILSVASRAPSGTNCQPWRVYVLTGSSRDGLVDKVCAAHDAIRAEPALAAQYVEEYDYYPQKWVSPYIDRRRENGWGLYGLLGIGKADKDKMHTQQQRNFRFFDAPVGLMFTVDRVMGRLLGRLWCLHAKHHGGCARSWSAHLPSGSLEWFCQDHHAAHRGRPRRNAGVRNVDGIRRRGRFGQHLPHPTCTGAGLHHLARLTA